MKKTKLSILICALFVTIGLTNRAYCQVTQGPYWYVAQYKVDWNKIDSLQSLVKKFTVPIVAQAKKNGTILDYQLMIHHTGGQYNLVIMTKYPSWDAIGKGAGFGKAFEQIEPNKAKRDAAIASFNWCFEGADHFDNIYLDVFAAK